MRNEDDPDRGTPSVPLLTICRDWLRLGCIGFGGPPTHIALLRKLCTEQNDWIEATEFEDAIATTNLLPGPASTQLAIYSAWRLAGPVGGILGGVCFIVPGLILILCLSVLFLLHHPPDWVLGAAAGAGAAIPGVALNAARGLTPASWERAGDGALQRARWISFALVGAAVAATAGSFLVIALVVCGVVEVLVGRDRSSQRGLASVAPVFTVTTAAIGGAGALAWVAFKVGALSYGGGFVIVPLMQHDAVATYHWMTGSQFLTAVALGQITPGPVVQTVAVVGYAAGGIYGGLLAALIAFSPSFVFVLAGGRHFAGIRRSKNAGLFLKGAGPAVIGAIAGSAVPLGLELPHLWQIPVVGGSLIWFFALTRGVVSALLLCGVVGVLLALSGVPV